MRKIIRAGISFVVFLIILRLSNGLHTHNTSAQNNQTEYVQITIDSGSPNGWTYAPMLSASGNYIAFVSEATNLVPSDTNSTTDIFLHDVRTGETQIISVSSDAVQANARSWAPTLSADGRFIAYVSLASNLTDRSKFEDTNALADVFVHDRQNKTTEMVSINFSGESATGWSDQPAISGDGRIVVFVSTAQDFNEEVIYAKNSLIIYDRTKLTAKSLHLDNDILSIDYEVYSPAISMDGRYIAFIAHNGINSEILLHDLLTSQTTPLPKPESDSLNYDFPRDLSISGDGSYIVVLYKAGIAIFERKSKTWNLISTPYAENFPLDNEYQLSISSLADSILSSSDGSIFLHRPDLTNHSGRYPLAQLTTYNSYWPAISQDGSTIAFINMMDDYSELVVQHHSVLQTETTLVTGWVGDGLGHPVVGVTVSTLGRSSKTDHDGNFSLQVPSKVGFTLTPEKKGVTFFPKSYHIPRDQNQILFVGASFTAQPDDIIVEASKDIGMPYSLDRGCPSPFEPCGGPFHGFYRGDCTDLVLDAYLHGVDLNIQLALELDFQRNPRHYYRWRNARNSQDMWRFFSYAGLILSPGEPYKIGDIVFFDWESDAIIDHVAVISEVTSWNYPQKIIDATGIIDDNPDGLASELPWITYHATSTPGHARWLGNLNQQVIGLPAGNPILVISLDSPAVRMQVLDLMNRSVSLDLREITGSQYMETGIGELISIDDPLASSDWFFIEIKSQEDSPYQIGIQTILDGDITHSKYIQGELSAGSIRLIPIQLSNIGGRITFITPER